MLTRHSFFSVVLLALSLGLFSCDKDAEGLYEVYQNLEVVDNTYTGQVKVTSTGSDPAGDFEGTGNSGSYSFAWKNAEAIADVRFDITTPTGSVQMIINDHTGVEILNETKLGGVEDDTFSGLTRTGVPGTWLVTLVLTDFNGDGSYSLNPGN